MRKIREYLARRELNIATMAVVVAALVLVIPSTVVWAAAGLAQGYRTSTPLVPGTIVSVDSAAPNSVLAASSDQAESLLGVVVNGNDALLLVTSGLDQVQVATSGIVDVFVTDLNGEVRAGDKITASPLEGVGMKAVKSTKVVGLAQADFSKSSPGATKQKIKDKRGKEREVNVGHVPVIVGVAYYVEGAVVDKNIIPVFLQNIANEVAGKKVQPLPIILSSVIIFIALIIIASLIYGSIRSSIISIGRNPLSQSAVYRSLLQISGLVMGILVVSLVSVYLILARS